MNKPLITEDDYLIAIKDEECAGYENHYLRYLPEKFKTIDFVKRIIDEDIVKGEYYYLFQHFPNEFRDNKELFLKIVNKQPLSLNLASYRLKNDKELVLEALNKSMQAQYYIGKILRDELNLNNIQSMPEIAEYLKRTIVKDELENELLIPKYENKKIKI